MRNSRPPFFALALLSLLSPWLGAEEGTSPLVERYRESANRILVAALADAGAYEKLEILCDDIGARLSGSPALEKAVVWATETLAADGHENVRAEEVSVPRWVRGAESLEAIEPRGARIGLLGLGGSVGTPPEGITAEVVVVRDEAELDLRAAEIPGKIVLFDHPMPPYDPEKGPGYGLAVRFRVHGARLAAAKGAVACLVRSVTARSLYTPHTGMMTYGDAPTRIPAAAIPVEDAAWMARLAARGRKIVVRLAMEAADEGLVPSANVVAELVGREAPAEVVVIGGHIDSWDVGHGAHDDGAGCVIAMQALTLLRRLELTPRRTIRVVLWTNEENGLAGAKAYAERHADQIANHTAAIESDSGGFHPVGFGVAHADPARQERAARDLAGILELIAPLGATRVDPGSSGADVGPLATRGVVALGLLVDESRYFDYHHTPADTFDKISKDELSRSVGAMAVVAYVLADMPGRLGDDAPSGSANNHEESDR